MSWSGYSVLRKLIDDDDDDDDDDFDDPMILNNRAKNNTSERTIVPWTVIFSTAKRCSYNSPSQRFPSHPTYY